MASVSGALMQSSTAWPTVGPKPRWPPEPSRTTLREPSCQWSRALWPKSDNDAAFGGVPRSAGSASARAPASSLRFGIPVAESEHLVRHVDDVPRLQVGDRLAIGGAARLHVGPVEFAFEQGSLVRGEHQTHSSMSSRIQSGKSVSSIVSIGAFETQCAVPNFARHER